MNTETDQQTEETALARPSMAGNANAIRHGAFAQSKKVLALRRKRIQYRVRLLFDGDVRNGYPPVAPWLVEPDRPLAMSWSRAKDMVDVMFSYLEQAGLIVGSKDGDLVIRSLEGKLRQWMDTEMKLSDRLGLNPAARAALRVDALTGDDLAARASKLRNGHSDN